MSKIIYRQAIQRDIEQIKAMCEKEKIRAPQLGLILVAVDEEGKIHGLGCLKVIHLFEPLICEEPMVCHALVNRLLGAGLTTDAGSVMAIVKGEKKKEIETFEKFGFTTTDENMSILEINL